MNESILETIKKMLGLDKDYLAFDTDIIVDINSTFLTLAQLGVGGDEPFNITGYEETWRDFLGDDIIKFQAVQTYIYLKVRLLFDPPNSGVLHEAMERLIKETEWRLNVQHETEVYISDSSGGGCLPGT